MPNTNCNARPMPTPSESDIARFWAKVDVRGPDECWPWKAGTIRGYGVFWMQGASYRSHRVAYFIITGNDLYPLDGCHSCDRPICNNPAHVWPGTDLQNHADRDRKGRTAKGDRHFSKLHPELLIRGDRHYARTNPERLLRGEKHGMAKTSLETVMKIRKMRSEGATCLKISGLLGIPVRRVYQIAGGQTWAGVS